MWVRETNRPGPLQPVWGAIYRGAEQRVIQIEDEELLGRTRGVDGENVDGPHLHTARGHSGSHIEILIIYKLGSRNFKTQIFIGNIHVNV